tara:strand:- start:598 stop:1311 length:714 start_codon:yes stop_codon:yes gene_type:complete
MAKICLWSSPRNVSTALMYSFAQRSDTTVFDEPLYAHYLKESGVIHPGREEVLLEQENEGNKVVRNVLLKEHNEVSFHKLMTHFLVNIDRSFLSEVTNLLLIRNPSEIISSYAKVIPNPKMEDVGIQMQYDLYHQLKEQNQSATVLDAKELLKNPKLALKQLCDNINIPFQEKMLSWEVGARKEDGCWAKYWYSNVHQSTGFIPYQDRETNLKGSDLELAKACQPYYDFLYEQSIKV